MDNKPNEIQENLNPAKIKQSNIANSYTLDLLG